MQNNKYNQGDQIANCNTATVLHRIRC